MIDKLKSYLKTPCSELFQIVSAFTLGLLFGPLSWGIGYNFLFIIIYELLLFYFTKDYPEVYRVETRIVANLAGICGWILGRYFLCKETGLEKIIY
jgi:hypothetical protein